MRVVSSQFLAFRLGSELLAVPLEAVSEILFSPLLSRPPGLPKFIAGVFNLGGTVVPVVDFAGLAGMPPSTQGPYSSLILFGKSASLWAIAADSIHGIVSQDANYLPLKKPVATFNDCVSGELNVDGKTAHVLALEQLLLREEQQRLEDFRDREQMRLANAGNPVQ